MPTTTAGGATVTSSRFATRVADASTFPLADCTAVDDDDKDRDPDGRQHQPGASPPRPTAPGASSPQAGSTRPPAPTSSGSRCPGSRTRRRSRRAGGRTARACAGPRRRRRRRRARRVSPAGAETAGPAASSPEPGVASAAEGSLSAGRSGSCGPPLSIIAGSSPRRGARRDQPRSPPPPERMSLSRDRATVRGSNARHRPEAHERGALSRRMRGSAIPSGRAPTYSPSPRQLVAVAVEAAPVEPVGQAPAFAPRGPPTAAAPAPAPAASERLTTTRWRVSPSRPAPRDELAIRVVVGPALARRTAASRRRAGPTSATARSSRS